MFNVLRVVQILIVILMSGTAAFGQRHEAAFTSGGLKIGEQGFDLPQNIQALSDRQHNALISAGVVLRF